MMFHPRTIVPVALALAVIPAAAQAQPGDETYRIRFHYHDSELASWGAAASVYDRIARAARRSCSAIGTTSLLDQALAKKCREELVTAAVAKVDSPVLAAVHGGGDKIRLAARGQD